MSSDYPKNKIGLDSNQIGVPPVSGVVEGRNFVLYLRGAERRGPRVQGFVSPVVVRCLVANVTT